MKNKRKQDRYQPRVKRSRSWRIYRGTEHWSDLHSTRDRNLSSSQLDLQPIWLAAFVSLVIARLVQFQKCKSRSSHSAPFSHQSIPGFLFLVSLLQKSILYSPNSHIVVHCVHLQFTRTASTILFEIYVFQFQVEIDIYSPKYYKEDGLLFYLYYLYSNNRLFFLLRETVDVDYIWMAFFHRKNNVNEGGGDRELIQ